LSGGDISHDGRRIAVFQLQDGKIELAVVRRDGSRTEQFKRQPPPSSSLVTMRHARFDCSRGSHAIKIVGFATHSVQERATAFRVFVQSTRRQPGLRETHRDLNGPSFPDSEAGGRVNMRRSL
jgi:hypothetical protein